MRAPDLNNPGFEMAGYNIHRREFQFEGTDELGTPIFREIISG